MLGATTVWQCYPTSASEAVIAAAEKKKVAVMISVISKKTYSILCDLCSPVNPKNIRDKTFEQVCELLQQHFKPKQLEVTKSYRFHHCFKEENETVSVYSTHLRRLVTTCTFGNSRAILFETSSSAAFEIQ